MSELKKCKNCGRECEKEMCTVCFRSKLKFLHNDKVGTLDDFTIGCNFYNRILEKIKQTDDQEIRVYLKELAVIKMVTSVEITFRDLMRIKYPLFNNLEKLFPNDEYLDKNREEIKKYSKLEDNKLVEEHRDINIIRASTNSEDLEADYVATSFNFQSLEIIDNVFSKMTGFDFFQTINDLEKNIHPNRRDLKKDWALINDVFNTRHRIVHDHIAGINEKELFKAGDTFDWLIDSTLLFFDAFDMWDMGVLTEKEAEELFGCSSKKIIEIMEKNKVDKD